MSYPPRIVNVAWWTAYFAAALALQLHFPGIDALIPGIVLSCQEQRPKQTLWLCGVAILIQEGTGSLDFGGALLWYALLLLLFNFGRLFFVTGSLFFIVLLSLVLGVAHSILLFTLCSLQGFTVGAYHLVQQAIGQAFLIPPMYAAASLVRKRFLDYEYGI